jgi:SsrA-binding protein
MGQGKKHRDQREDIKKRDWERDQGRILKNSRKFS